MGEGEDMVGGAVVCGGVGEGIPVTVDLVMTAVLLDGEGSHSVINNSHV